MTGPTVELRADAIDAGVFEPVYMRHRGTAESVWTRVDVRQLGVCEHRDDSVA